MADRVLITGISGFLGGHVALALLKAGYRVRGSLRDLKRAAAVEATLKAAGADISALEFVALDLTDDAGWAAAMEGVRFLQHTASPFLTTMPADKHVLIGPAVAGTERAINAALAGDVERIVLTSSMAAIVYGHDKAQTLFTAADWTNLDGRGINAYVESKTRAERRAWDLMQGAGRAADLTTVNPSAILGPLLDDDPGTSVALVARFLNGGVPAAPRMSLGIVDVRDVADLHVIAMTAPIAAGQRLPISADTIALIDLARAVGAAFPQFSGRMPRFVMPDWAVRLYALFDGDVRGNLDELGLVKQLQSDAAVTLLGRPLIGPADAAIASAGSLIDRGLAK
ncbi:MAG TPA: NAD-dependent epimerase/dehydratase family protein [Devosiaceae bacterium]|jgi:nucleoside-diphosphate-sugar epimerase